MYTETNYKTKKALKEAVKAGETVRVFQPGPFGGSSNGRVAIEGPHYPAPHTWYASATIADNVIVKVS
jgi:hypothetical protein